MPNPWTGKGNPYTKQEVRDRLQVVVNQKKPLLRPVPVPGSVPNS